MRRRWWSTERNRRKGTGKREGERERVSEDTSSLIHATVVRNVSPRSVRRLIIPLLATFSSGRFLRGCSRVETASLPLSLFLSPSLADRLRPGIREFRYGSRVRDAKESIVSWPREIQPREQNLDLRSRFRSVSRVCAP